MDERTQESSVAARMDNVFSVIVTVLLVVIVAVLSVLWIRERRLRMRAEYELIQANRRVGVRDMLGQMLQQGAGTDFPGTAPGKEDSVTPVRREDLIRETVTFKGRPRTTVYISRHAGERFGFRGGDLVVVGGLTSTQGTTRPSTP